MFIAKCFYCATFPPIGWPVLCFKLHFIKRLARWLSRVKETGDKIIVRYETSLWRPNHHSSSQTRGMVVGTGRRQHGQNRDQREFTNIPPQISKATVRALRGKPYKKSISWLAEQVNKIWTVIFALLLHFNADGIMGFYIYFQVPMSMQIKATLIYIQVHLHPKTRIPFSFTLKHVMTFSKRMTTWFCI